MERLQEQQSLFTLNTGMQEVHIGVQVKSRDKSHIEHSDVAHVRGRWETVNGPYMGTGIA